jgi:hypothetical protein
MRSFRGQVLEALPENGLGGYRLETVGIHENLVASVEVDVIEVGAAIAEQPYLRKQDVAIGNGIRTPWLEIRRKRCLRKIAKQEAAKVVSAG